MDRKKILVSLLGSAAIATPIYAYAAGPDDVSNPTTAGHMGIVDCQSQAHIQPNELTLTCADGGYRLSDIKWSHWPTITETDPKRELAIGNGRAEINVCEPSCAEGKTINVKAKIRVNLLGKTAKVTLIKPPAGTVKSETFKIETVGLLR